MRNMQFSKLKKQIENLFDPALKLQFCCIAYPMRTQWANNHIPRFYVELGKEIIWDFPKDFPDVKQLHWAYWSRSNGIVDLVREYIDTPVDQLLEKKFKGDTQYFIAQYLWENRQETCKAHYRLTDILKAADRRLGKEKLMAWAAKKRNAAVKDILEARLKKVLRRIDVPLIGYRLNSIGHVRSIEFRQHCIYFDMALLGAKLLELRPDFILNKNTCLWIPERGIKLPLSKCAGIPVAKKVTKKNSVLFQLYFPLPENWDQLDFIHLIEDENDSPESINQYKICLTPKAEKALSHQWGSIKSKSEITDL